MSHLEILQCYRRWLIVSPPVNRTECWKRDETEKRLSRLLTISEVGRYLRFISSNLKSLSCNYSATLTNAILSLSQRAFHRVMNSEKLSQRWQMVNLDLFGPLSLSNVSHEHDKMRRSLRNQYVLITLSCKVPCRNVAFSCPFIPVRST